MQSPDPIPPQKERSNSDSDWETIGLAIHGWPMEHSLQFFLLAVQMLNKLLFNAGALAAEEGTGGYFLPHACLWIASVKERRAGLRALMNFAREFGFENRAEVAYFDAAEGYWRTVHPGGAPPFARFLEQPQLDAAKQHLAEVIARARSVLASAGAAAGVADMNHLDQGGAQEP